MPYTPVNSATTLSLFTVGNNIQLFNSNTPALFTDGAYSLFSNNSSSIVSGGSQNINFGPFNNLSSMSAATFTPPQSYSVNENELNLPETDPSSYSYFGSFTTDIINALNSIILDFPYAILSYDQTGKSGTTLYGYSQTLNNMTGQKFSTFQIPMSALTNQGGIILNSGSPLSNSVSLVDSYTGFTIQMSANTSTGLTVNANIISYTFSSNTLFFTTDNWLDYMQGLTQTSQPVYIRPSPQVLSQYNLNLNSLEYNLLYLNGSFIIPNAEISYSSSTVSYPYPRTLDGFSPDNQGLPLQLYQQNMINVGQTVDLYGKSNILTKYAVPSNLLDNDSNSGPNGGPGIFSSIIQAYSNEFDTLYSYIRGISYAWTVTYDLTNKENTPSKYLYKFANLFGWKLSNSFQNVSLFDYLGGDADLNNNNGVGYNNSYSYYNIVLVKYILASLPWIYKNKGNRRSLQFLFDIQGGPPALLNFNEKTYNVNQITNPSSFSGTNLIASDGYPDLAQSNYIFQEGGNGRGTGVAYIQQYGVFNPIEQIDNIKTYVGNPVIGTRNTLNTKQLDISLSPSQAIEYDNFEFYKQSGTSWNWGTVGIPFSSLTVPFELSVSPTIVSPPGITGFTFSQWLQNVYMNSIDPTTRKTLGWMAHAGTYQNLRNIYLNYMLWSNPESNRLTPLKLQAFLDLIELNFEDNILQALPATAIPESFGTLIKNTEFDRQRYVYPPGVDRGSMFQLGLPLSTNSNITPLIVTNVINGFQQATITPATINGSYNKAISPSITAVQNSAVFISTLSSTLSSFNVSSAVFSASTYP